MKLLNIIFLSILSLNAFGAALTEEPISPGTIAPAAASSFIAPQTHNLFLSSNIILLAHILWTFPQSRTDKGCYAYMACLYSAPKLFADHVDEAVQSKFQPSAQNLPPSLLRKGALFLSHAYLALSNAIWLCGRLKGSRKGKFSYSNFLEDFSVLTYNLVRAALQYQTIKALENPQAYSAPTGLKTFLKPLTILSSIAIILRTFQHNSISFWAKTRSALINLYNIFTGTNFTTEAVETAERHIAQQRRMHKSTETRV